MFGLKEKLEYVDQSLFANLFNILPQLQILQTKILLNVFIDRQRELLVLT